MKNNNIWLDFVVFQILLYLHILQIHHSPPHIEYADDGEQPPKTNTAASSSDGQPANITVEWYTKNISAPIEALVEESTMQQAVAVCAEYFIKQGEMDLPFVVQWPGDDKHWTAYKSDEAIKEYVEALCTKWPIVGDVCRLAVLQREREEIDGDMTDICRSIWAKCASRVEAEGIHKRPAAIEDKPDDVKKQKTGGSRPHP